RGSLRRRFPACQKFLRLLRFIRGHLDQHAAGAAAETAAHFHGFMIVHHDRMKVRRFEPRPDEMSFLGGQASEDGDEIHGLTCGTPAFGSVGPARNSANTITPAPVWSVLCTSASTC